MRLFTILSLALLTLIGSVAPYNVAYSQALEEGKAGILLTPTRLVLEGRQRSGMISVANNGTGEGTYRAELVNRRMLETGGFEEVVEPLEGEKFADGFLRISPRRFTLRAGQHQNVRILARKPADLEEGEYRSHLRFVIVPPSLPASENDNSETLSISIRANFGMSIPVIVRHGAIQGGVEIDGLKYSPASAENENRQKISFEMERSGKASVYGDLKIIYQPPSGDEVVIKSMGGIAVYAPNQKRLFDLDLNVPDGVNLDRGTIKVIYSEKENAGGRLIAQKSLKL